MSKQNKKHAQHLSPKNYRAQKRSHGVRLEVTPEQLLENGNLQGAIEVLQTHLRRSPQDDQRWRILGQCLFDTEHYNEAAATWLSVPTKNANDFVNIGIAFLNTEEWDQSIAHLESALQLQEHPRTCYLLAIAHARGRYWFGRDIETIQRCISLLQQARALPACPPEVYLSLDKALWSHACEQQRRHGKEEEHELDAAREQGFQIIEEAFSLYTDHEEVRMEYAKGLMYRRKQYEAALLVLVPLLSGAPLSRFLKEEVIGLSVEAALSAHLYAQAIQYLHYLSDIYSESDSQQRTMLTILKGDLSFRQNDVAAARICYEQAIQSDLFVPRFLGHFCSAWTYLLEEKSEQACALVKRASAEWFEHNDPTDLSSALDSEPVCIGTVHIGDDSPALCVKLVCEKLLQADTPLEPALKGHLCYFVYQYHARYYKDRLNVVWEHKEEHEQLLLQAAELFEHPLLCETLTSYFEEKGDLPQAVEYHLRWCIHSFKHDTEDFDEDNAEYAYNGEEMGSQELRLLFKTSWVQR